MDGLHFSSGAQCKGDDDVLEAVLSQNAQVAGVHVKDCTTRWSLGRRFYFCGASFWFGYKCSWEEMHFVLITSLRHELENR